MEKNKTNLSGSTWRKTGLVAAVLLTAVSLAGCVVAQDRDYYGGRHRHHHWNNQNNWNGGGWNGGGSGWQGGGDWNGDGGSWNHHH